MTRKMYFVKQRLIGIITIVLSLLSSLLIDNYCSEIWTICMLAIPMGVPLIFTKKMLLVDNYYLRIKKRKMRAR